MTGKLLLGPIVGGLSHKRAFLWGRAQGPGVLHAWLGSKDDLSDARLAGRSLGLEAINGFAGVAPVSGFSPDTRMFYTLTLSEEPPAPGPEPYPEFTSFPLPGQPRSFAFAFGSCFRREASLEDGSAGKTDGEIFKELEKHRISDALRFILLLGDQIYADAYGSNGLKVVACSLDEYRQVYTHTWKHDGLRQVLANLPAFMTLDDHEVDDDWAWTNSERTQANIPIWDKIERWVRRRVRREWELPVERARAALQSYWEHQGMHAPPMIDPPQLNAAERYSLDETDHGSLAYEFSFGAAAFFVLDTRTQRIKSQNQRIMLGEGQWQALESWLLRVKDDFPVKFIVSSCSLLHRMLLDFPRDRWSGFPQEQARLLHFLALHGIRGVYLLAGDLHSAHAISADLYGPNGQAIPLWEFCSSPFQQQTNWISRFTYAPLNGAPLKNQVRHFTLGKANFGVVRVDFDEQDQPQVRFEVYGKDGVCLAATDTR